MHIRLSRVGLLTLLILIGSNAFAVTNAPEPTNLSQVKHTLIRYHDTGKYHAGIAKVVRNANYYLRFRLNQNKRLAHPQKLAIVLDIDETALSNYADMKTLDFGGTAQQIINLEADAHDPAIPYVRALYSFAKAHQVAIFFVSERKEKLRAATVKNLRSEGYRDWNGLYMETNHTHLASTTPYKTQVRQRIAKHGYDIVLNLGDQQSDLKGGYADMAFKLPNPYYLVA